jgi:hypothetical protein
MRKITVLTLAMVMAASMAFAYGGYGMGGQGGQGYGMGYGNCAGAGQGFRGKGMRGQGFGSGANFQAITKDQAQVKAEEFVAANLKGYTLGEAAEFQGRRFTAYQFKTTDANGNEFIIVVNPRGFVRGPFVPQQQ